MAILNQNNVKAYKISIFSLFLFLSMVFGTMLSCITYKSIDFQAMRPAQVKIGQGIERIDIHCEYCNNEKAVYSLDSSFQQEAIVSLRFLESLKENLQKSPIFQNTRFSTIPSDSLLTILKNHKARSKETGLVILLDSIFLNDTIIHSIDRRTNTRYFTYGNIHKFGCRTYIRSNMQVLDNHLMEDTLFWPPQPNLWLLEINLPDVNQAYQETGQIAGEKYSHYLAPYWTDQSRIYYHGTKTFNLAYKYLQNNDLDSALYALKEYNKGKLSRNLAMMNLHNLAVIYELKDDIDNAYLMADSAYKVKKTEITKNHIDQLRIRKLDKAALDWQLN